MTTDYRPTVFLPKTSFPMRASLPAREPEILERWERQGLYRRLRESAAGREKFILHDGPPYANGHLHMGTALNKILKDVVNRSQQMLGKDAVYVPGLGLSRPADRVADRAALPAGRQGQGRGADRRVPARVPRVRRALDRRPARRVQAPGRGRRLGPSLHHDGVQGRGRDLPRARQVPAVRRAVPRQEVGDVVGGGEDRARRGRGRVSRPHLDHDHRPLPGGRGVAPGAGGRLGPDLDHHALDHPGQPRGRVRRGRGLPGDRGDRGRRRLARAARREAGARRGAWSRA